MRIAPRTPTTRICCLTKNQIWEAPVPPGSACKSLAHGHMNLEKVAALLAEERMEMVTGTQTDGAGVEKPVWIPVAQFVRARTWRKKISSLDGASVGVMQLVP